MIRPTRLFLWMTIGIFSLALGWTAKIYFFPPAYGHWWTPVGMTYLRGYRLGVMQARDDLGKQTAMVLELGDNGGIDRSSGLRIWSMGDVWDRGTEGYIAGYNDVVKSHISRHGVPKYSWKQWEDIIFNAAAYFDRDPNLRPEILRNGSAGITSPDSKSLVTLKTNPNWLTQGQWQYGAPH